MWTAETIGPGWRVRMVDRDATGQVRNLAHFYAAPERAAKTAKRIVDTLNRLPELIDVLNSVTEFLDNYVDVVDGDYGEPRPNRAMSLKASVDEHLEALLAQEGAAYGPV
jgi:hypothetical protein